MATSAGSIVVDLDANSVKLLRELKKAQQKTNSTAQKMRKSMARAFGAIRASVLSAGTALAAFGAFRGFARVIGEIDQIGKLVDRLGGSTEAFSELQYVADRSGVAFNTLTMGLQRMSRRVAEAANGFGEAKGALLELNLSAISLAKLPLDKQFERIADALALVKNDGDKTRLAMKLFDSEGVALLQTMKGGASAIRGLRDEAKQLGISLNQDAVDAATKAKDAMTAFSARVDALKINLTLGLMPAISQVVELMNRLFDKSLEERIARARAKISILTDLGLDPEHSKALKNAYQELFALLQEGSQRIASANTVIRSNRSDEVAGAMALWRAADQELTEVFAAATKKEHEEFLSYMRQHETAAQRMMRERQELYQFEALMDPADFAQRLKEINAIWSEGIEEINLSSLPKMKKQAKETFTEISTYADQAARNMQDAFANFLFDPFEEGLKGMLKGFLDTIRRMLANQMAASFFESSFGKSLTKTLTGRASGGPVSAGTPYMVGERGPEVFVPKMSGQIIPSFGGSTTIYNIEAGVDMATVMSTVIPALERTKDATVAEVMNRRREGRL